jgi:hypothetical protein
VRLGSSTSAFLFAWLGLASSAKAADPVIRWAITADPEGCDDGRLSRATALACDALGHACVVAADGADRRATLRCSKGAPWILDVYDGSGALRWTLAVPGDDEGLHGAAILIARTELDAPPGAVPVPPHETPPAPPSVAPPAPAAAPPAGEQPGGLGPALRSPGSWGLVGKGSAVIGSGFGLAVGGQAGAAFIVWRELTVGFGLGGEHGLGSASGYGYSAARVGANVGYGAPWGPSRFGAMLEVGAMLGDVMAPSGLSPSSQQFLHAYGRASAIVQWTGLRALRPFAAVSLVANTAPVQVLSVGAEVTTIPWISAAIDLGLAWRSP